MASLILRRDLSLEVPKLLVGTVQPYQTLAGAALTTSFVHQPELLPFQSAPLFHASVAPLYFHTLLHTLAEYAETPRAVQHSHVKLRHAPKADFWDAVGTLNCFYFSAHGTPWRATEAPGHGGPTAQHPAMGAVELVRPSHRKESDVKLTLFDADHQPLASMLMTGPKTVTLLSEDKEGGAASLAHRRTPLPPQAPPTELAKFVSSALPDEDFGQAAVSSVMLGGTQVCGGLYGEVVPMGDGADEGYAHRAYYWADDLPSTSPTTANINEENAEADGKEKGHASPAHTVMPPWVSYNCVEQFFHCLRRSGRIGDDARITPGMGWRLASHHVVQVADAVLGLPMEIVCAAPHVHPRYRLPPWRYQLGLPVLSGGDVPTVALRCEVRQGGQVVSTGVYFFCRWS